MVFTVISICRVTNDPYWLGEFNTMDEALTCIDEESETDLTSDFMVLGKKTMVRELITQVANPFCR